jgi:hypothetical protein
LPDLFCLIISDQEFSSRMRVTIDPNFLGFMLETASNQQHAMAGRPLGNLVT